MFRLFGPKPRHKKVKLYQVLTKETAEPRDKLGQTIMWMNIHLMQEQNKNVVIVVKKDFSQIDGISMHMNREFAKMLEPLSEGDTYLPIVLMDKARKIAVKFADNMDESDFNLMLDMHHKAHPDHLILTGKKGEPDEACHLYKYNLMAHGVCTCADAVELGDKMNLYRRNFGGRFAYGATPDDSLIKKVMEEFRKDKLELMRQVAVTNKLVDYINGDLGPQTA